MRGFLKFSFFSILWTSEISNFVQNREKLQFWTKFDISDGHKIEKNENFKNPRISFLYHLDIYLYEQIWLKCDRQFSQIWSIYAKKWSFFCKGWLFPIYILKYRPHVSACKTKNFDNWVIYEPILERRKMRLQHQNEQNLFWLDPLTQGLMNFKKGISACNIWLCWKVWEFGMELSYVCSL